MTVTTSPALAAALSYYTAWTSHNMDVAMSHISRDVVCDSPAGRIEGIEAFEAFMGPFSQIVVRAEVIAAFGDESTALLMYDTETIPVKSAPGAESITVRDGKIIYIRIVFDRVPFDSARAAEAAKQESGDSGS
jgi:hypothetical protein